MPHGGARANAGRKPAPSHSETRKIILQAADDGVLPLKVMLDNLRFYTKEADRVLERLLLAEAGTDEQRAAVIEEIKTIIGLRKLAGEEAARAAPYCHPRQKDAIDEEAGNDFVPLSERLKAYQRRDEIETSGGKVVDFPQ